MAAGGLRTFGSAPMKAMILAAGVGARLRPLTETVPKPALPVGNRPLLHYTTSILRAAGVTRVGINLYHLASRVSDVLGDGSDFGLQVTYSRESSLLGTAGGIKKLEHFLGADPFFVVNGDILSAADLGVLRDQHRGAGAALTLGLRRDPRAAAFGLIGTDEEGRICRFLNHKPQPGKEPAAEFMFSGIHVWEPEVLREIPPRVPWDFSRQLFPHLLRRGVPLYGFPLEGYWSDVGTPERYLKTHWDLLGGECPGPGLPALSPGSITLEGECRIAATAELKPPVLLGPGCVIGEHATVGPWAVLGRGGRIENGASVTAAVLWEYVIVGREAQLENVIATSGCRIPPARSDRGRILTCGKDGRLDSCPLPGF